MSDSVENDVAAEAWDRCAREAHDLGWLHDWALSDLLERNPYRRPIPPAGMPDPASLTPEESNRWAEALDGRHREGDTGGS